MLIVDAKGLPLGFHLTSANHAEVTLVDATLAQVRVPRPRGRAKTQVKQLIADRAFDSGPLRRALRHRGIAPRIPTKRRPANWKRKPGRPNRSMWPQYRERWVVERTFAWTSASERRSRAGHFRRLPIRWDRSLAHYQAFFTFACTLILIKRVSE